MSPETSSAPSILIVEDEPSQRMAIHHHLKGLGSFVDFADPVKAIAYLRSAPVDAVIVDIHFENTAFDGLWFLKELRTIDTLLGAIIRTGDDDSTIADAGIESRVVRRIIKACHNEPNRLREAVRTAIEETRERRLLVAQADSANQFSERLLQSLSRCEDELTAAELCRGHLQELSALVTTLSGYSDLVRNLLPQRPTPLSQMVTKMVDLNRELIARYSTFLNGPFGSGGDAHQVSANECMDALKSIFSTTLPCLHSRGSLPDFRVQRDGSKLITALRHLALFLADQKATPEEPILATWSFCSSAAHFINAAQDPFILGPRLLSSGPAVRFSITSSSPPLTPDRLRLLFRSSAGSADHGNLSLVASIAFDLRIPIVVTRDKIWSASTFHLLIPV